MNPVTRSAALPPSRWALRRSPRRVLADHLGISPSRTSHRITDGTNCVAESCALTAHPMMDGLAIVHAHVEALEWRYLEEAKASPTKLRARLDHLIREAEHHAQARQDRALQTWEGVSVACRDHAHILSEIPLLVGVLGMEEE